MVSCRGLDPGDSALYRLSRPRPESFASCVMPARARHVAHRDEKHVRIRILQRRCQILGDRFRVGEVVGRVKNFEFRLHCFPRFNSCAIFNALLMSRRWPTLSRSPVSQASNSSERRNVDMKEMYSFGYGRANWFVELRVDLDVLVRAPSCLTPAPTWREPVVSFMRSHICRHDQYECTYPG